MLGLNGVGGGGVVEGKKERLLSVMLVLPIGDLPPTVVADPSAAAAVEADVLLASG